MIVQRLQRNCLICPCKFDNFSHADYADNVFNVTSFDGSRAIT